MTSVCWVICSSSTSLGLQLRTKRHQASTCSEDSRQGLGQIGPSRAWQDTSQCPTIICLHTPLLGKYSREEGGQVDILTPVIQQPRGRFSGFTSLLLGLQGEGLFPPSPPFKLSSERGWRNTHRNYGCPQPVNLRCVPTSDICLGGKGGRRHNEWWITLPRARTGSAEMDLSLQYIPPGGGSHCPLRTCSCSTRDPACGYWLSRVKVNSHRQTEKQEYTLRSGNDWQMTPFLPPQGKLIGKRNKRSQLQVHYVKAWSWHRGEVGILN